MTDLLHHTHAVRRLYRPDLPRFRDHLLRLDPQTRYDRFGLQVSDEYLADYAQMCFAPGALTYGYFEDGGIRGAAELRMFHPEGRPSETEAEAAFSVERGWRRKGIGSQLMSHIVLAARNRHITTLTILCLRHNQAMLNLARKFETELTFELNDVTGHIAAKPPNALSIWREAYDTVVDLGGAALDYQGRILTAAIHPNPAR